MSKYDWSYLVGQQIGYLTVLEVLPSGSVYVRPNVKSSAARCLCKCGRECYKDPSNLKRRQGLTCGSKECKSKFLHEIHTLRWERMKAKKLNEGTSEDFPNTKKPILLQKLKPKYICTHPDLGCTRSCVLNICCWECDKECKKCCNKPELCGAKRRKE